MSITWLLWTSWTRHLKTSQDELTTYFTWCGRPTPRSEECRWRTRWRSVHGRCCYYPEFLIHTAYLRRCSTQERWPGQGRGSWPVSGGPGRIFCGSYGSSRSRRCSWGNRWRLAAIPLQTRSTLVRCYPRPLWERAQGWNPESPARQHKTAAFDWEKCTTFCWLDQIDTIRLKPWMNTSTDKTENKQQPTTTLCDVNLSSKRNNIQLRLHIYTVEVTDRFGKVEASAPCLDSSSLWSFS